MQLLRQGQAIQGPDGVYMVVVPPTDNTVNSIASNLVAVSGTASYGPPNVATPVGSAGSLKNAFVGLGLGAYDLATELAMLLRQGTNNLFGIRVTDGTDTYAAANLLDGSSGILSKDTAYYTGSGGNGFTRTLSPGSNNTNTASPTSWKVTITRPGYQPEVFDNIPTAGFQAAYLSAINNGQAGARGPSQLIKAALPTLAAPVITGAMFTPGTTGGTLPIGTFRAVLTNTNAAGETTASNEVTFTTTTATSSCGFAFGVPFAAGVTGKLYLTQVGGAAGTETFNLNVGNAGTATLVAPSVGGASAPPSANTATTTNPLPPAAGTGTFTGGTDGAAGVTTSTLLGVDGMGTARTGMYAMRGKIAGGAFYLAGVAACDTTTWSTMLGFGQSEYAVPCFAFPLGTSSPAAIALQQTVGVRDWQCYFFKDWLYIKDTDNAVQRYVSPIGQGLGFLMNLSPEQSPASKPMTGFIGTERTMGGVAYDSTEALALENAGILYITNPVSYGNVFGFAHGRNGSSDPNANQVNYTRMTLLITLSLGGALGRFIGRNQSALANDPTRRRAKNMADTYMEELKRAKTGSDYGQIVDFVNVVDASNNNQATTAAGLAFGSSQVTYLGVVEKFIWSHQGGAGVVVTKG
jgi:hypothetical protein